MGDLGIKVSKAGEDVLTAADEKLIYSSAFNTLKVFAKGSLNLPVSGAGDGIVSVAHNLGFAPAFKAFIASPAKYVPDPGTVNLAWGWDFNRLHVYTDDTYLYFQADNAFPNRTYVLKYYIFADLAQTFAGSSVALTEDYGIKMSQPGFNVKTARLYELSYSSSFPALKFDDTLVGDHLLSLAAINCTDAPNDQNTSVSIAHGLGYQPFFLCGFKTDDSTIYSPAPAAHRFLLPWSVHSPTTDAAVWSVEAYCTATHVVFNWYRLASCVTAFLPCDLECINWGAGLTRIHYYIFREDLSAL